jgi:hypothetical protein
MLHATFPLLFNNPKCRGYIETSSKRIQCLEGFATRPTSSPFTYPATGRPYGGAYVSASPSKGLQASAPPRRQSRRA